jgi:hypothetical protein
MHEERRGTYLDNLVEALSEQNNIPKLLMLRQLR